MAKTTEDVFVSLNGVEIPGVQHVEIHQPNGQAPLLAITSEGISNMGTELQILADELEQRGDKRCELLRVAAVMVHDLKSNTIRKPLPYMTIIDDPMH